MCRDCGCEAANKRVHLILNQQNHPIFEDGGGTTAPTVGFQDGPQILESLKSAVPIEGPRFQVPAKDTKTVVVNKAALLQGAHGQTLSVEERVLAKNDAAALKNRQWLDQHHIRAVNMISSPGAGKTYLLEKTLERLAKQKRITILTGDLEKDFDAQRLTGKGGKVKQINTLSSCHLDASMISRELGDFVDTDTELLVIENVGNLVCPAAFDLGEHEKIALLSTTEGEDKPAKYPLLFHTASLVVITKVDLIPHLDWDLEKCKAHIRSVNPTAPILEVSAKTGQGMQAWLDYLSKV